MKQFDLLNISLLNIKLGKFRFLVTFLISLIVLVIVSTLISSYYVGINHFEKTIVNNYKDNGMIINYNKDEEYKKEILEKTYKYLDDNNIDYKIDDMKSFLIKGEIAYGINQLNYDVAKIKGYENNQNFSLKNEEKLSLNSKTNDFYVSEKLLKYAKQYNYNFEIGDTVYLKINSHEIKLKIVGIAKGPYSYVGLDYLLKNSINVSMPEIILIPTNTIYIRIYNLYKFSINNDLHTNYDDSFYTFSKWKYILKLAVYIFSVLILIVGMNSLINSINISFYERKDFYSIATSLGMSKKNVFNIFTYEFLAIISLGVFVATLILLFLKGQIIKFTEYLWEIPFKTIQYCTMEYQFIKIVPLIVFVLYVLSFVILILIKNKNFSINNLLENLREKK